MTRPLRLRVPDPPVVDRLLDASQVATEILDGHVTPRWVVEHVPHGRKLGRKKVWPLGEVKRWKVDFFKGEAA